MVRTSGVHLSLRVAGAEGRRIVEERYAEYPEPGEPFVVRMLSASDAIKIADLDVTKVRTWLRNAQSRRPDKSSS